MKAAPTVEQVKYVLGTINAQTTQKRRAILKKLEVALSDGSQTLDAIVAIYEGVCGYLQLGDEHYSSVDIFGREWVAKNVNFRMTSSGLCIHPEGEEECIVLVRGDAAALNAIMKTFAPSE